jgi:hypothetical protein
VSDQRADRIMADLRLETRLRAGGPNPAPIEALLAFQRCSGASVAVIDGGEVVRGGWRVQPEMAGAGLWTTAGDLARVAVEIQRAHVGRGRLLSKGTIDQALTPGPSDGWGLGLTLDGQGADRRFGHGGDNIGFKARTSAYLERGQGAAVLTNGDDGIRVIEVVFEAIGREYGWPDAAS